MQSLDRYLLSASYVSGTEISPKYTIMKQILTLSLPSWRLQSREGKIH